MKREQITLTIALPAATDLDEPTFTIEYDGSATTITDQSGLAAGASLREEDVDVAFRLIDDETGVLSVADRHTGAFLVEVEANAELVKSAVDAAENNDDRYRVELVTDDETWRYEKKTFLVYDSDGQLLRNCSLIPGSVEL